MLGYKINDNKKISINKIEVYNKPKKVYIPLASGNDLDATVLCKKGDYVKLGEIIAKTKGDMRLPILSSVSGNVVDFVEKTYANGKKVKCIVIENDFDSELNTKKIDKKYTKEEFIEKLKEKSIIGMSGNGFPTYVKYDSTKKIKTMIINAVECEPYITCDYVLIKEHCEEILESIDMIMEINGVKEAFIAINKENIEIKALFDSYLGTYPNIKIANISPFYPVGYERLLVKNIKNEDYKNTPLEKGIVVSNVSTIYAIYQALVYNNPLIERVITLTGLIPNPVNVLVRVGTLINEVISNYGKIDNDLVYIASGPMMGKMVDISSLVLSPNLTGVVALNKSNDLIEECIKCGKCINVCPKKLCPIIIKENLNDLNKLKELKAHRCIECGLCSYICPSKIDLRNFVKEGKDRLNGDK